jgi:hypothetical protein
MNVFSLIYKQTTLDKCGNGYKEIFFSLLLSPAKNQNGEMDIEKV